MATFNKFYPFVEYVPEGAVNLGSDTLKVMLTNTAPTTANGVYADITEIAAGNGYTTGGTAATVSSSAQSGGVYKLVCADVVFTASGGSMAGFRYAVLYDSSAATKVLIGYWDYGSTVTLASGESMTVDFSATNGVFQLS